MNQSGQPNMVLVPMPAMPEQPNQRAPSAEVPPRVVIAMALLAQLNHKSSVEQPGECESHNGFRVAKGQRLTGEETKAQIGALSLLRDYFAGTLEPTGWDVPTTGGETPAEAVRSTCPACLGRSVNVLPACPLCGGSGNVRILKG